MLISVTIHESWLLGSPAAVAEFVRRAHAMERPSASLAVTPAPVSPIGPKPPATADEDLGELLSGMDDALVTVVTPVLTPAKPPLATPASRRPVTPVYGDGPPTTGQGLYRWCVDHDALKRAMALAKARGYPKMITHFEPDQVADVYHELVHGKPVGANGRSH